MKLSNETTLGFTNKMTNLQKSKAEKVLNKTFNVNGKILSEKELIVKFILEGYKVIMKENYSYQKRNGELSKPKNVYRIFTGEKTFLEITKTAYDFALYLIENNLNEVSAITAYMDNEKSEIESLKIEQEKQKEINDNIELELLKKQKEESERTKKEKLNNWNNIAIGLLSECQVENLKSIIFNTVKSFIPHETSERINHFIDNSNFISLLGNQVATKNRIRYLFDTSNMDYLETNLPLTIEHNIYKYTFDISESNTQQDINNKINKFYNGNINKLS